MLEFLFLVAVVFLIGGLAIGLLKLAFFLLVLPIKAGFWLLKGVIGLVFVVPVMIVSLLAASVVMPVVLVVVAIPVLLVIAGIAALVHWCV